MLNVPIFEVPKRLAALADEAQSFHKQLEARAEHGTISAEDLLADAKTVAGVKVVVADVPLGNGNLFRQLIDQIRQSSAPWRRLARDRRIRGESDAGRGGQQRCPRSRPRWKLGKKTQQRSSAAAVVVGVRTWLRLVANCQKTCRRLSKRLRRSPQSCSAVRRPHWPRVACRALPVRALLSGAPAPASLPADCNPTIALASNVRRVHDPASQVVAIRQRGRSFAFRCDLA